MSIKVTTETLPERQVKLQIEIDDERHGLAIEAAYKKLAPRVDIPGFRRGKAPRKLIEKQLGRHRLLDEAMDSLVPDVYNEVIEQEGIQPVARPSVELVSHEPLVFTATVPLQPVVDLGDYQSLRVEKPGVEIAEERVEEALQELRTRYGTIEPVERAAQDGDVIRADVHASADGLSLFSSDEIEFRLIESNLASLPGLYETVLGLNKGDEVEKTHTAPEDHTDERVAGKQMVYKIKVHEVKEEKLAELNDDFAKEVGEGFETLLALRTRIREDIESAENEAALRNYETQVVDALAELATIDYPPVMVEHEIDHILEDQANLDPRDPRAQLMYLRRMNLSEEEVRESVREEALQRMRRSLVLSHFTEAENIEVGDEDIDAHIESIAAPSGEQADAIRQIFQNDSARDSIRSTVLTRKSLDRLIEIASQPGESTPAQQPPNETPAEADAESGEASDTQENQ